MVTSQAAGATPASGKDSLLSVRYIPAKQIELRRWPESECFAQESGEHMTMAKKSAAEFLGTFWLVYGGCGSAVLAAAFPAVGIGLLGVALAFGLTVLTMAYAIGHISGCHLNPAISVGLCVGGRFPARDLLPYIAVQVLGAI